MHVSTRVESRKRERSKIDKYNIYKHNEFHEDFSFFHPDIFTKIFTFREYESDAIGSTKSYKIPYIIFENRILTVCYGHVYGMHAE